MRNGAIIGLLFPLIGMGQSGAVQVRLDTNVMRIGEHVMLTILVDAHGQAVAWPAIGDTIGTHIEVLHDSGVDTIANDRLVRRLELTSFDTGFWAIAPFRMQVDGRPLESDALLLEVRGVQLDSTLAIHDIHDVYEVPFSWEYWLRGHWHWFAYGAGAILIAVLVIMALRRRKPRMQPVIAPTERLPLDERTLLALRALEQERLWQNGAHKEYQSRLTDVLRAYIEERYSVPALERTTDELLHELRVSPLGADQQTRLANMLRAADMVKFAKALPAPAENEQMMAGAIRFVQDTALQPPVSTPSTPGHAS